MSSDVGRLEDALKECVLTQVDGRNRLYAHQECLDNVRATGILSRNGKGAGSISLQSWRLVIACREVQQWSAAKWRRRSCIGPEVVEGIVSGYVKGDGLSFAHRFILRIEGIGQDVESHGIGGGAYAGVYSECKYLAAGGKRGKCGVQDIGA